MINSNIIDDYQFIHDFNRDHMLLCSEHGFFPIIKDKGSICPMCLAIKKEYDRVNKIEHDLYMVYPDFIFNVPLYVRPTTEVEFICPKHGKSKMDLTDIKDIGCRYCCEYTSNYYHFDAYRRFGYSEELRQYHRIGKQ